MYIDSFKVFCDLVDTESFSKAAEKNNITQSAVSQQVRNLEIRFGVTLVERGRRQVSLSPEGAAFLEACRKIVSVWNSFEDRLGVLKNEIAGEIVVATTFSLGLYELPRLMKSLARDFPEVRVKMRYTSPREVYDLVDDGTVDAGVVPFAVSRKDIVDELIGEDELIAIVSPRHPLAAASNVELSALAGLPFVSFQPESPTRKFVEKQFRDVGVKVKQVGEYESVETIKRVVQVENAVSIVPAAAVQEEIAAKTLSRVALTAEFKRPLSVLVNRVRPRPPGLKELLEILMKKA